MSAGGRLRFLRGVDAPGAKPPAGFPHRFAVLTWFERGPDAAEPWPLLRAAVPEIAALVGAETVIAESWQRRRRWFLGWRDVKGGERPWAEVIARSDDALHERSAVPSRLRFVRGGAPVLWMHTVDWHAAGGPAPYHDCCELSCFAATDRADELEAGFRRCAQRVGASIAP